MPLTTLSKHDIDHLLADSNSIEELSILPPSENSATIQLIHSGTNLKVFHPKTNTLIYGLDISVLTPTDCEIAIIKGSCDQHKPYEQLFVFSPKGDCFSSNPFRKIRDLEESGGLWFSAGEYACSGIHHQDNDLLCYALGLSSNGIAQSEGLSRYGSMHLVDGVPNAFGHQRKPLSRLRKLVERKTEMIIPVRIPYVLGKFQEPIRRR